MNYDEKNWVIFFILQLYDIEEKDCEMRILRICPNPCFERWHWVISKPAV